MLTIKHDAFAVNPESAVNSDIFLHLFIAFHTKIMYNTFHVESYRSGHNEAHSKCVCRFSARGFESLRLRYKQRPQAGFRLRAFLFLSHISIEFSPEIREIASKASLNEEFRYHIQNAA